MKIMNLLLVACVIALFSVGSCSDDEVSPSSNADDLGNWTCTCDMDEVGVDEIVTQHTSTTQVAAQTIVD